MQIPVSFVAQIWAQCEPYEVPTAAPISHPNAGGWMLLIVTVAILIFEAWAIHSHNPTISQWVKRTMGKHRWWKWLGGGILGALLWHLIFGGPIRWVRRLLQR